MAQRFVSPGVFTTEIDETFLAQGVAGIGAAIVGLAQKGPAFTPTITPTFDGFKTTFGDVDPDMMGPYAAKNYLKNAVNSTYVRVLGSSDGISGVDNGYEPSGIVGIASSAVAAGKVYAVIHTSGTTNFYVGPGATVNDFIVTVTGSSPYAMTASFLTSSSNYITKVLNTDPTKIMTYGHYVYSVYSHGFASLTGSAEWSAIVISGSTSHRFDYKSGSTPWVTSNEIGGQTFNLFKFHTKAHGNATNGDVKVYITNVKASQSPTVDPYGTFDVVVRRHGDTDFRQQIIERFIGCSFDKTSRNYIARKIGDQNVEFNTTERKFLSTGDYPSKSAHIRIEMNEADNFPPESLPWGHRGYDRQVFTGTAAAIVTPPDLPYVATQHDKQGNINNNVAWGWPFISGSAPDFMKTRPTAPVWDGNSNGLTSAFTLKWLSGSYNSAGKWFYTYNTSYTGSHQPIASSASIYTFGLPFQGGFDGWNPCIADPLHVAHDKTEVTAATYPQKFAVTSLKRAIDCVSDPDSFDMNLFATPGVVNFNVTDYARTMVNERSDAAYIMDITGSTVVSAIQYLNSREIDDNYTACYYPNLRMDDKVNNAIVQIPPSVAVMGALAYSDRVGQVFFAPAGLNRGGLGQFDVIGVTDPLTFKDRNDLYDARINPIASFPVEGIVVFGQKTLQVKSSALDRLNVRRLLIYAKKTIASAAKYLLFEPNNPATWTRFLDTVNPILDRIRQDQGIERFKVVMDRQTNTQDVIDRNTMVGKIFLQPTRSAEFIDLSFIITNSGVAFQE